jgi:hypothetical protein
MSKKIIIWLVISMGLSYSFSISAAISAAISASNSGYVAATDMTTPAIFTVDKLQQTIADFESDPQGRFADYSNLNVHSIGLNALPRQFICTFPQGQAIADFMLAANESITLDFAKENKEENPQHSRETITLLRHFERRLMEVAAWDLFIAANQNYLDKSSPSHLVSQMQAPYVPRWGTWLNPKNAEPALIDPATFRYNTATLASNAWRCEENCLAKTIDLDTFKGNSRMLGGAKLIDQAGNPVFYESRGNTLLNQHYAASSAGNYRLNFPLGQCTSFTDIGINIGNFYSTDKKDVAPAVSMKIAWKVLTEWDDPARYLTQENVAVELSGKVQHVTLGMVGMHLAIKEQRQIKWRWITFEQRDNLDEPQQGSIARPSFFNPNCKHCCTNLYPYDSTDDMDNYNKINRKAVPAQLVRTTPLPESTIAANHRLQTWLGKQDSTLQFYKLVDTQYTSLVAPDHDFLERTPRDMRNAVLEPYVLANKPYCQMPDDYAFPTLYHDTGCMGCHQSATYKSENKGTLFADFTFLKQIDLKGEQTGG